MGIAASTKIVGIHNPYWDTLGGGERYVSSFAKLLLTLNWKVEIFWPKNIADDIKNRFGIDLSQAIFSRPRRLYRYDVLFWLSDGSLPTSFAKKTIIHLQFPFQHLIGKKFGSKLKARQYTFVVNSKFTKSFIDKEFGVNSIVIYPPIATADFVPRTKTNTILYVGRFSHLTQLKNPHLLIKAFKQVYTRFPDWQLVIAGGSGIGTVSDNIKGLYKLAEGLPIRIVTNPDIHILKHLYSQSKIFWSASGYTADESLQPLKVEHFGMSVVEAMSAGCVPIITNLGGHKEIVNSGESGYLWDKLEQLPDITIQLINEPEKMALLSANAITRSKEFDINEFNRKFMEIL